MSKMYTGAGRIFQEVSSLPMDDEGLQDLKRRIKVHPHFLGEPLVVMAEAEDLPSLISADNGTMVAIDAIGQTAAVTVAIGMADINIENSALLVAANLANLSAETLGRIARSFIDRPSNELIRRQWEDLDVEMSDDAVEVASLLAATFERDAEDFSSLINKSQRVIIAAEAFSARLIGVIEWLNQHEVNIIGLRYQKFIVGGQDVFSVEQIVPQKNPAKDAPTDRKSQQHEPSEPWRIKGRDYYSERLSPRLSAILEEIILITEKSTFSLNYNNKYYFWIKGSRRNVRVRTYSRDRLEIGFHNAAPAAVAEFLEPYSLESLEVAPIGGYSDSPFIVITPDMRMDNRWSAMLNDWLSGATPGATRVTNSVRQPRKTKE